jgi:hypothetical protein
MATTEESVLWAVIVNFVRARKRYGGKYLDSCELRLAFDILGACTRRRRPRARALGAWFRRQEDWRTPKSCALRILV